MSQAISNRNAIEARTPTWAKARSRLVRASVYLFLAAVCVLCLAPFYFMFAGALMAKGELLKIPPLLWPKTLIWHNYRVIFGQYHFLTYLRNSVIISFAKTAGVLFVCSLAGFIFAKRQFPGR